MSVEIYSDLQKTKTANLSLLQISDAEINQILIRLSEELVKYSAEILQENQKDLSRMKIVDPKYDRLQLTRERINDLAHSLIELTKLPSPLHKCLEEKEINGLHLQKISVPFGVVGVIYEARPNVTIDVFALCLKSGNCSVLKGSTDAFNSNSILVKIIQEVLLEFNLPAKTIFLMPPERKSTEILLQAENLVDVLIPRGSQSLINFVRQNSQIPVIETGAGVCHTFLDYSGNLEFAKNIVFNAKNRRPSVCNSLDCLIIEETRLNDLRHILQSLAEKNVQIFADEKSYSVLNGNYPAELLCPATDKNFGQEFLSLKMAVKTVSGISEAIDHINKYGSGHSEAIISDDKANQTRFQTQVDAAAVYVNTSTAFTDGGQFGLGCEIGISTQKLHARGPMGLTELTTYKWLVTSEGKVRE